MNDLLPLRSVLADPSMACVGYIADSERADYQAAAEALDYAVAAIDFSSCTGKDDALARFARAIRSEPQWSLTFTRAVNAPATSPARAHG